MSTKKLSLHNKADKLLRLKKAIRRMSNNLRMTHDPRAAWFLSKQLDVLRTSPLLRESIA